jgi:hypothetical protein
MPELLEQVDIQDTFTADFSVVRALLKKGSSYDQAVKGFEPYKELKEPNPGAREAMRRIAERAWKTRQPAHVFVNNRLEGNAPSTIEAVVDSIAI